MPCRDGARSGGGLLRSLRRQHDGVRPRTCRARVRPAMSDHVYALKSWSIRKRGEQFFIAPTGQDARWAVSSLMSKRERSVLWRESCCAPSMAIAITSSSASSAVVIAIFLPPVVRSRLHALTDTRRAGRRAAGTYSQSAAASAGPPRVQNTALSHKRRRLATAGSGGRPRCSQ